MTVPPHIIESAITAWAPNARAAHKIVLARFFMSSLLSDMSYFKRLIQEHLHIYNNTTQKETVTNRNYSHLFTAPVPLANQMGAASSPGIYRAACSPRTLLASFLDFLEAFFSFGVITAFFLSSL
jgi:hypothetical protein